MTRALAFIAALALVSCGAAALAKEDVNSLHDAELATARAYAYADGGAGRAFDRMAYCSIASVLRRSDAGAAGYDTHGAIECAVPGRQ